jgi:hypothetical protein
LGLFFLTQQLRQLGDVGGDAPGDQKKARQLDAAEAEVLLMKRWDARSAR